MLVTKDTETAQNKYFAINDIRKRAEKAYDNNPQLFNNPEHIATVQHVTNLVGTLFAYVETVYETARPATKRYPAHTEVKFNKVTLFGREKHNALMTNIVQQLEALDLDLIYKPNSNSYSIKIK